jgi:hypothetical protein
VVAVSLGKRLIDDTQGSSVADVGSDLREIHLARQHPGEPRRRWFTSSSIDLFVWVDAEGRPTGFQLCYDKKSREHALSWAEGSGFSNMAVDGGESRPARPKGSPILVADGVIDAGRILLEFRREARALPPEIVEMVETQLGQLGLAPLQ